jgi:hypothetical protein
VSHARALERLLGLGAGDEHTGPGWSRGRRMLTT